jgi:hypothetical protein
MCVGGFTVGFVYSWQVLLHCMPARSLAHLK